MYVLSVYRYVYDTRAVSLSFFLFDDADGEFAAAFCCCTEMLCTFLILVAARHHVHTLMVNLNRERTTLAGNETPTVLWHLIQRITACTLHI